MRTKYKPEIDKGIVNNIRLMLKGEGLKTERTDEELFGVWVECYFCKDCDKEIVETIKGEQ